MNIVVITYDYPDKQRPVFIFVKSLIDEWGKMGHKVTVISPFSITGTRSLKRFGELDHPENVRILRPLIVSLSNLYGCSKMNLTDHIHKYAVNKTLNKLDIKPDFIYCHFWKEAIFAYNYASKNNIQIVVASGESDIPKFLFSEPFLSQCRSVSKVICVSSKNKKESIEHGLTTPEKCIVLPNAIDNSVFKVFDQSVFKKQLGITDNDFVVAFVGWFNERKGSKRLSDALIILSNPYIKALFIGEGSEDPDYPGSLFKGRLAHEEIPKYLNCADVFVLPTLKEGCCNAIIEAMACALPVISSKCDFNSDILDETNSILVEPTDVSAIASAIDQLYNNEGIRNSMKMASLKKAEKLSIKNRAQRIIDFINT